MFFVSTLEQIVQGSHRVVAVDMRGYNESEKPAGIHNYHMETLVEDIRSPPSPRV